MTTNAGRTWSGTLIALVVTAGVLTSAQTASRAAGGVISGSVVDQTTGHPIARAMVMVAGTDVGVMRVTSTDATGHFALDGLPAGRLLVSAGKPPYIAVSYGAMRAGRPGTILSLATGEKRSVTIGLVHGAAIGGKVVDDHGDAVPGARVRVLQRRDVAGEISLSGDMGEPAGATTDDRGFYRVFGLPPGDYAVAVQPRRTINGVVRLPNQPMPAPPTDGPTAGFESLYYGDTIKASGSTTIALAAGQERTGADVHVKLVPLVRVDGTLATGDAVPPRNLQITLRPRGLDSAGTLLGTAQTNLTPDGHFSFAGVQPGAYTIYARTLPPPGQPQQNFDNPQAPRFIPRWATKDIEVGDANVTNVALTLRPALTLTGKLIVEGMRTLPEDLPAIRVSVRPTLAVGQIPPIEPVPLDASGHFTIPGIIPGKYRLFLQIPNNPVTQAPDWFPKSAIVNGRDILDAPLEVTPEGQLGEAVVTLTDDTQEVDGTVRDATGKPVRDCTVVMFSTDSTFWFPQSRRIVVRPSGNDGLFVFGMSASLPTGEYYLAAVLGEPATDQFDIFYLSELAKTASRVTLRANDSKKQDLKIAK
jgi:Carboxypeptidase regulatory-like domain